MGREADGRGAGGDAMAATRRAVAPGGSRPPAVLVLLAALLVAGTIVTSVVGTLSLASGGAGPPLGPAAAPPELATPPAAPATDPTEAAPTPAPTAERPAPPAVFQDPALRTLAEPFLTGPATSCEQRDPAADVAESVACDLGDGRTAVFSRMVTPDAMRDQRRGIVAGRDARADTVLSVRWRYVGDEPETRAGIPPPQEDRGEGVRVRFVDRDGVPRLYFDQDSSGCIGDIALTRPTGNTRADLDALRTYWADPAE